MKPPYYAAIFTFKRTDIDEGYTALNNKLREQVTEMPGFLGMDAARQDIGISITYWESLEHIQGWKEHSGHQIAQKLGKQKWYEWYHVRICKVEKEY